MEPIEEISRCGHAHSTKPHCTAREEAEAQAFLFYCFVFGQSLLFLERGQRKRAQLIAKSAETLLDG